jgi:transcriptional regulator with XRE-family HTH domain
MPTKRTDPEEQAARTQRFAEYMRRAVSEAGYDIESQRGGGRKALARDAEMSQSSVGRMLAGQTMPDPSSLERLARVLGLPLTELLVQSGLVSPTAMPAAADSPVVEPRLTPSEAALRLGITTPARIAMFESLVEHLLEQERQDVEIGRVR